MARIKWDEPGEHLFETGVDQGVLYVYDSTTKQYGTGVVWNGLTSVSESPEGADATALYADNIKYLNLIAAEDFKASIEAYTYPDEFAACNGEYQLNSTYAGVTVGQQERKMFAFSYRTKVGSDTEGNNAGYKIHIVYGCYAAPSEKSYETINDSPEAITFSWEISTTPVPCENFKPTAHIVIDSITLKESKASALTAIENSLYGKDPTTSGGSDGTDPTLLMPDDIADILSAA